MFWTATESSITWLPGFKPDMIPVHMGNKIRFVVKDKISGLEIKNLVGTIPLINGDTLQIKPKVGEMNFFRMLLKCEGLYSELKKEIDYFVAYQETDNFAPITLIARRFVHEINYILKASPRFERTKVTQKRQFVEGKVIPIQTAINLKKK